MDPWNVVSYASAIRPFYRFYLWPHSGTTLWGQNVYETIDHLYTSISMDAILLSMSKLFDLERDIKRNISPYVF